MAFSNFSRVTLHVSDPLLQYLDYCVFFLVLLLMSFKLVTSLFCSFKLQFYLKFIRHPS
jgi:hypothetical protein